MSEASELIAQQILNASINKKNWGQVLYNVKVFGAQGDGIYDDTQAVQDAIDTAIFNNATLVYFPPGEYAVTDLSNTETIHFVGDNASFVGYEGVIEQFGEPPPVPVVYIYNVKEYGAVGDGVTDDTTSIQNAVNAAQINGGTVYVPCGTYSISSSILITKPITIMGEGNGVGPHVGGQLLKTYASVIEAKSSFSTGDMFSIVCPQSVIIDSLQFSFIDTWTIDATHKRTSGAAIAIQGSNPAVQYALNNGTIVRRCSFIGQFTCIDQRHCVFNRVYDNFFYLWKTHAVVVTNLVPADEVTFGWIENNYFYGDTDSSTTQLSAINIGCGYGWINKNYILGANSGIIGSFTTHIAGRISIKDNSIEQQITFGMWFLNANTITVHMLEIVGNQFSSQNYPTIFSSHIYIQSGTPTDWAEKVLIKDNIVNSTIQTAGAHFSIQSGRNILIEGNVMDNYSYANSQPINIGSVVSAPCIVRDNMYLNFLVNSQYSSNTTVKDTTVSYTVANMPSFIANGSQLLISDGKPTSGTDSTLVAAGPGTIAYKINGVWKAIL